MCKTHYVKFPRGGGKRRIMWIEEEQARENGMKGPDTYEWDAGHYGFLSKPCTSSLQSVLCSH